MVSVTPGATQNLNTPRHPQPDALRDTIGVDDIHDRATLGWHAFVANHAVLGLLEVAAFASRYHHALHRPNY